MKYGSPEMWATLRPEIVVVAVDKTGEIYGFSSTPQLNDSGVWDYLIGCGRSWPLDPLLLTDLPTDWRESLRARPHQWIVPDDSTPIDAPVWGLHRGAWLPCHYAGPGQVFCNQGTSWLIASKWRPDAIVLPNPSNRTEPPPADWRPI